jgi:hypothetical protein
MNYRLLLDVEVIDFMQSLPRGEQIMLRRRLAQIQSSPIQFADFQEREPNGRSLDVHIHGGFAISYWDDFPDRHVKIFSIRRADV